MREERTIYNWSRDWWEKYPDRVKEREAEYPEIDREYVVDYPCDFGYINPQKIWDKYRRREGDNINCYVHIPFCRYPCRFCVYNRYPYNHRWIISYLKALKQEIELYSKIPYVKESVATTLYFGGGTPTILTTEQFTDLLTHIKSHINVDPNAETTVEAHPKTVDKEKLEVLYKLGVNRVSFGVQTFNDKILGYNHLFHHKKEDSIKAIKTAQAIGFPKVCIDLMYRLPEQTLQDWKKDLNQAIELRLTTLSLYSLILPPSLNVPQPSEKQDIEMYQLAVKLLTENGYKQYAASEYSLPEQECLYLKNLWQAPQQKYLGFGSGAVSFIHGYTYVNIHSLDGYCQEVAKEQLPVLMGKELSKEEEMSRYFVLGVKCLSVDKRKFKEMFGVEVEYIYGDVLKKLQNWGLITVTSSHVKVNEKGKIYIDNISKAFYTENNKGKRQTIGLLLQRIKSH